MHNHNHEHSHRNIGIVFFLNLIFSIFEFIGGLYTNSTAIMSDALHDLGDALSIGLAFFLEKYSLKQSDKFYSYGYKRFSLLSALINSIVLIIGSVFILINAIKHIVNPIDINVKGIIVFAIIGLFVNLFGVFLMKKGKTFNQKVLVFHLLEDVFGWLVILIMGIVLLFIYIPILDPILSIVYIIFILYEVIKMLIQVMRIFLQAVPKNVNIEKIIEEIEKCEYVMNIHDIHLWSLDGEHSVMSLHVVIDNNINHNTYKEIKEHIRSILNKHNIYHSTIEIDMECENCIYNKNVTTETEKSNTEIAEKPKK